MRLTDIESNAMDSGTLSDWYISSVGNESPVWTEEHIDELLNDFYVIPKDVATIEAEPVRHGEWKYHTYMPHKAYCPECEKDSPYGKRYSYCPNCGAKMDGG